MTVKTKGGDGVLADVTKHLGGIFRHMLPGILVVGAAVVAFPEWFCRIEVNSWLQLATAGAVTVTIGNTWFALNRYGLHQGIDYIFWRCRLQAPARTPRSRGYLDDLSKYTYDSLHAPESAHRAQQHVAFRASIVLLILTLGELSVMVGFLHSKGSVVDGRKWWFICAGAIVFFVGVWQMAITRRIDHYVVRGDAA